MSVARVDLVGHGARRVALSTTAIVAVVYVLIAAGVLLIVTHNLVSSIDATLSQSLETWAATRQPAGGPPPGPHGGKSYELPVLWWMYHPDGNFDDSSPAAKASNLNLPVSPTSITGAQTLWISGTNFRVMGGRVGDDWAVVGQSMSSVEDARTNLIQAELLIGPVLLLVVFLGALAIGRRVAMPVEQARQRQMDFTANASHELRTPLAVIQAQASLALSQERSADWYRRSFEQVNRESQRMRHLVDDLLWLARFESTPRSANPEPVDVGIMTQNAVDRFGAVAEAKHQRLTFGATGDAPVIAASPEWLDHLVGVLLDNACKYAPDGGSIDARVSTDAHSVRLTVDDSGPGIPESERSRIFDRFRRATDQPGGAGLGLAIANAIVQATNGKWVVGTSPAGGASMGITWPRVLAGPASRRSTTTSPDAPPLASLDA